MEMLFESRPEIRRIEGDVRFVQVDPQLHPEPVLVPEAGRSTESAGVAIYGTVLQDGGRLRMWYQAWSAEWQGENTPLVACAESDDGITWKRLKLDLVDVGGTGPNNLCDFGVHCPSVFVDPRAPASHRYRATGTGAPDTWVAGRLLTRHGYYTAHSADGIKWELDAPEPRWTGGDVITSVYHPGQDRAIVALKKLPYVLNVPRRAIWNAELNGGVWSAAHCALVPDEFDDVCALGRGFASGDYYGMAMMPAATGTVGFIWQFRHNLPRTQGIDLDVESGVSNEYGVNGVVDVSLAYQAARGDRWLHVGGRRDFLRHGLRDWCAGGVYTASCPVAVGDEHRLYLGGTRFNHGMGVDAQWRVQPRWVAAMREEGVEVISYASWPRYRLFGYRSATQGTVVLDLGRIEGACEMRLNFRARHGGHVRVELEGLPGYGLDEAIPLEGDHTGQVVAWSHGTRIAPPEPTPIRARIHLERADVYAYALR